MLIPAFSSEVGARNYSLRVMREMHPCHWLLCQEISISVEGGHSRFLPIGITTAEQKRWGQTSLNLPALVISNHRWGWSHLRQQA